MEDPFTNERMKNRDLYKVLITFLMHFKRKYGNRENRDLSCILIAIVVHKRDTNRDYYVFGRLVHAYTPHGNEC